MTIQQLQQYPMGEKGLKLVEEGLMGKNIISCWGTNAKYKYVHVNPEESIGWYRELYMRGVTPVLYPLSCLTKEIEVYGERFVPMERIKDKNNRYEFSGSKITEMEDTDYCNINIKTIHNTCYSLPFWLIQLLQSWFINYQGIEAVNPFDLEVNPYL